ncbi:hypothetical protein [Rosettibacter firmus]|uniref:hypothetical protein n=1 Tax=Rosettibacter firmus TaxID=3111522 RepID=UPI00336BFF15
MMKTINFKTILFALCSFSFIYSQDSDSLKTFNRNILYELREIQSLNDLSLGNREGFNNILLKDPELLWIKTKYYVDNIKFQQEPSLNSQELTTTLYNNYLFSQKYATYKSLLGYVQVGATAYLAYQHFKKHKILKKK